MILLVKNVRIVDGSGQPPYKADVIAVNGRITGIGNFSDKRADRVINGLGGYLAPGFIDVDTDTDHCLDLFRNPQHKSFLRQGVTTVLGGLCGSSLAPILYGHLDSMRWWSDSRGINIDWRTEKEFLHSLRRLPLGVNFGTLVGHYTLRFDIAGERERIQKSELAVMEKMLSDSLRDGAFGLSFGLGFVSEQKTSRAEISALAKIIRCSDAICALHLRNDREGFLESVKEAGDIAREMPVIISHFYPSAANEARYEKALDLIAASPSLYFDINLRKEKNIALRSFLPMEFSGKDADFITAEISKPAIAGRIRRKWTGYDYRNIRIVRAPRQEYLEGKTIYEFARNRDLLPAEGLLELMKMTRLRGVVAEPRALPELSLLASRHERGLIASNSSESLEAKGNNNVFMEYLAAVTEEISLENAVRKITFLPAKLLGLRDRGLIKEGYVADMVVFNDYRVKDVIVSGKQAVRDGECADAAAGKILIHHAEKKRR